MGEQSYGVNWGHNDIVIMEVNTLKKSLKFHVNDKDLGDTGVKINFDKNYEYTLGISMYDTGDSVQILSFSQTIIE